MTDGKTEKMGFGVAQKCMFFFAPIRIERSEFKDAKAALRNAKENFEKLIWVKVIGVKLDRKGTM